MYNGNCHNLTQYVSHLYTESKYNSFQNRSRIGKFIATYKKTKVDICKEEQEAIIINRNSNKKIQEMTEPG